MAPDLQFRVFVRWARLEIPGVVAQRIRSPLAAVGRRSGVGGQIDKLAWETGSLPAAAKLRREVLLHSPTFAAPMFSPCPLVVTIHDLIPLVIDGYHRSRQSALYSGLMAWAVRRAAAIITVSEHSRSDIIRTLHVRDDLITVIPEAADERFRPNPGGEEIDAVRERYSLPDRYVLYLGGAEKRKNVELLIRMWRRYRLQFQERGVRLVLVADIPRPDRLYPDIRGMIREFGLSDDISIVPSVLEDDKPAVYQGAELFCFPSTYEGFGLTPLEAMASGVPVICSNSTSLPEVVGGATISLPPDNDIEWGLAVMSLLDSARRRAELCTLGLARAATFSWEAAARATAEVYRTVLAA